MPSLEPVGEVEILVLAGAANLHTLRSRAGLDPSLLASDALPLRSAARSLYGLLLLLVGTIGGVRAAKHSWELILTEFFKRDDAKLGHVQVVRLERFPPRLFEQEFVLGTTDGSALAAFAPAALAPAACAPAACAPATFTGARNLARVGTVATSRGLETGAQTLGRARNWRCVLSRLKHAAASLLGELAHLPLHLLLLHPHARELGRRDLAVGLVWVTV
jgi:hypothetical protein